MAEISRVLNTTIRKFIAKEQVNVYKNRKLTDLLQKKGKISYNWSGEQVEWPVRFKQIDIEGYDDMGVITFARKDLWKRAFLPWRGYVATQVVSRKEKLMNKGREALVKVWDEAAKIMMSDAKDKFGEECYIDGNAAGNENRFHGVQSFLGGTVARSTGFVVNPDDTYANLDTRLAAYGGVIDSGEWPHSSVNDSEFDFWSPLIVDYSDTLWAAATDTWANTAIEALRYGIINSKRVKSGRDAGLDVVILSRQMFREFEELLDDKERVVIERGSKTSPLTALGWGDVVSFEGTDITYEYGVPVDSSANGIGFGFNTSEMELRSLDDMFWVPLGPYESEETMSFRFTLNCFGNFAFNPRAFVAWKKVT